MKIRVYHSYYGCDTGCCGHVVEVDGKRSFEFEHPSKEDLEDPKAWAKEFATRVLSRTNPQCLRTIDWESLELVDENGWGELVDGMSC